jgi:hypothetical protein
MAMQHARYRVVTQAEMVRHAKRLGWRRQNGIVDRKVGGGMCRWECLEGVGVWCWGDLWGDQGGRGVFEGFKPAEPGV